MGAVPSSYYDFLMHFAPYFYVVPTRLAFDAAAGQRDVTVADGSKFRAGLPVQISDSAHSEWNEVQSVLGNVVTMKNDLAATYFAANSGVVEGPDLTYGRGAFAAAFAIEFLCEAYSKPQFSAVQSDILAKVVALADWLLMQQCVVDSMAAYGGFRASESDSEYWSIDAGRCIPALLKAYSLAKDLFSSNWLVGWLYRKSHAILAGSGAGADYQVLIKVYFSNGVDGTEVLNGETIGKVYVDGKCKADFSDIRFTHSSNTAPYVQKLISKVDASYALFALKVSESLDQNQTFHFYFGNLGALDVSSDNAFISVISGITGAWPLDESSGTDPAAVDYSGNANNGVSTNTTIGSSKWVDKSAREFLTGNIRIPNSAPTNVGTNYAMHGRFKITGVNLYTFLMGKRNNSANSMYVLRYPYPNYPANNGEFRFGSLDETIAPTVPQAQWVDLIFQKIGDQLQTFVDGVPSVVHTIYGTIIDILDFYIGNQQGASYPLTGLACDIFTTTTTLTEENAQELVNGYPDLRLIPGSVCIRKWASTTLPVHSSWGIEESATVPASYLAATKLAGSTFLYNMQQLPVSLGVHDRYYGGFAQYVTVTGAWAPQIYVENLYCLVGLKMLADIYDVANASLYNQMMADAVSCLRVGLEQYWLYFDSLPSGDGAWHRVGLNNSEVYDDSIGFALLGLYTFEGWTASCQRVYEVLQSIRASGQYPAYIPDVCWPGYIDVVSRIPACSYYDGVTMGILWKIRKERDASSFKLAHDVAEKYAEEFLDWGPLFTDYSPITPVKAVANVSWIGRMFLNYEEPLSQFTRILKAKGEAVQLFSILQQVPTAVYNEPLDLVAVVSPMRAEQVLIEPGYYLNDFLVFYTFLPVRNRDKIRRQGQDFEVQTVTPFTYANQRLYFKCITRRLLS